MVIVNASNTRGRAKARVPERLSLSSLLCIEDDDEAEALVSAAPALAKKQVLAEFVAYHEDCLLATKSISPEAINDLIRFTKSCALILDYTLAVSKLIEISSYYENTGDIEKAITIAEDSLVYAETTSDRALQRKAYSRLGASYSRQFDFERSCLCYENALRLAFAIGDPLYEFAVLSNVVTLFDAMGLRQEASGLAHKLSTGYPGGTKELDLLHLQNSINGYRFATTLQNAVSMKKFHACATRKMRSVREVPAIWKAYFEANATTDLIYRGKVQEAKRRVERWAKSDSARSNTRVAVSLLSASVECAVALADGAWLCRLEKSLTAILPSSKTYPPDFELVLSLLAQVYEHRVFMREGDASSQVYARQLQDYVVKVRHRQFFGRLARKELLDVEDPSVLENPVYDVTKSMFQVGSSSGVASSIPGTSAHRSDDFFIELEGKISRLHALSAERGLRSADYCIAENWAVAAEFGSYGDGAHCFIVGALAHKIAGALHFEPDQCLAIELACRLHDIGKVGIPASLVRRVSKSDWHNSLYLRDHSIIGERLLQSSKDHVLVLASRIARSHHEWWNGFGYPDAIAKTEIPTEARICAVASEYAALTSCKDVEATWTHHEAVNQIVTMAGVQFDPAVVQAFLDVKDLALGSNGHKAGAVNLEINNLKIAKQKLDACVSSI